MSDTRSPILIAAGGTAGHLFPGQALATVLRARGWPIHLATDHRATNYGGDFPADEIHIVPSATITRQPLQMARAVVRLGAGFVRSWRMVRRVRPAVAVGFGGYPTLPPILAATRAGIPTIVHDQNAVLGRANRFLADRVAFVATSVAEVKGAADVKAEIVETGNPVREAVRLAAAIPYPERTPDAPLQLLVFGGSQGARFLSDTVPAAVASLPEEARARLRIVQQCRPEDVARVRQAYDEAGVAADLHDFIADLPARMAAAHLVVCRSGASTTTELTGIGRPAIMVPLPGALDQDQAANAALIDAAGGGWKVDQSGLNPEGLAGMLTRFVAEPGTLADAAARAKALGRLDGAERLADLVERAAGRN